MKLPITELEAARLLNMAERKSKARVTLGARRSSLAMSLVSAVTTGVAVFAMADFSAPMSVKVLVGLGFVFGVVGQVDSWAMQRRLDAAIELLSQAEDELR